MGVVSKVLNIDMDASLNAMVSIASNDTVYNLDTTARTSALLLYMNVAVTGSDQIVWAKKIDININ